MTETELTDRLREAIVLDGPDVWKTNGYLQDAQQAGVSLADALKRANEISQEVASNKLLFQNIRTRIDRLAQPSRNQFIDQDLNQIVNAASSLKLSPDFVKNQWVPTVLQRLAATSATSIPEPTPPPATQPDSLVPEPSITPPQKSAILEESVKNQPEPTQQEKKDISPLPESFVLPVAPKPVATESNYPEPPPIVRSFTAVPARVHKGQPVTLSWEVENLLAVTIDDLGEGLSPKNRGWVKPSKSTDYTLFDANNNPLSTVRVEVSPRDRSGVYGVLFALVLLAIIYWFIKSSNSQSSAPKPTRKTEQTSRAARPEETASAVTSVGQPEPKPQAPTNEATDTLTEPSATPDVASSDNPKKKDKPTDKVVDEEVVQPEPEPKPTTPADARQGKYEEAFGDKPYDKAEVGTDDRGWRRARSNGRWGYINEADEWVIKPEFEAVTPFQSNTASAFLNGQLITINRSGEQVRN